MEALPAPVINTELAAVVGGGIIERAEPTLRDQSRVPLPVRVA